MTAKQTDPQYKLRYPAELRDRVAEAAKENNRSINAEIVARLEWSFGIRAPPDQGSMNRLKELVQDLFTEIAEHKAEIRKLRQRREK